MIVFKKMQECRPIIFVRLADPLVEMCADSKVFVPQDVTFSTSRTNS